MSRPTGFAAKCRCGSYVGALDAARTDRADMGKILGEWLFRGMTVEPRFTGTWSVELQSCRCPSQETRADRAGCDGCGDDATDRCPHCQATTCGKCAVCEHSALNRGVNDAR